MDEVSSARVSSPDTADPAPDACAGGSRADTVAWGSVVMVTVLLVLMLGRVAQLQLAPGPKLAAFMGDRVSRRAEPAPRGDIRDIRGRVIASTRFGSRVFVDPTEFQNPPGDAFARLGDVLGMRPDEVAAVIAPKLAHNERLKEAAASGEGPAVPAQRPCRYVRLGGVLEEGKDTMIKGLGVRGVHLDTAPVRETPGGALVAGLLGRVGVEHNGLLGAELLLDKTIAAETGQFSYVRDAGGNPLWVYPGGYIAPERGLDVRLSVDLEIQRIVMEELAKGTEESDSAGGRAVVLDPHTGEVLAIADLTRPVRTVDYTWQYPIGQEPGGRRPRYTTIRHDGGASLEGLRNRCIEDAYEPGSTFKPFMWAEVMALGLARADEIFHTGRGYTTPYRRHIADVHAEDSQTFTRVLVNSSNIGMVMATSRMSYRQMRDSVARFGFGSKTSIGLPGESTGLVTPMKRWGPYSQSSVAMGHEIGVTPLQMARAFSIFARTGEEAGTLPAVRLTAAGEGAGGGPVPGVRVLPRRIAELTREAMRGVTQNLDTRMQTWDTEKVTLRYEAFGKSGTAEIPLGQAPAGKRRPKGSDGYFQGQYNASFIAAAPVASPRLVVVVVIDDPGPERVAKLQHYGARAAGPVVRRILERSLAYLGAPPTYPDSQEALPKRAGRSVASADR